MIVPTPSAIGVQRGELRLHVRGKRRIRRGAHVDRARPAAAHVQLDPVRPAPDGRAGLLELEQHRVEVVRAACAAARTWPPVMAPATRKVPVSMRSGCTSYRVPCSLCTPSITMRSVPAPLDLRAHGDQEIRQVDHLRFARRVLEHGLALGQRRRHHQVLGAGDGHGVEHQVRAPQAPGARADVAVLDVDVRAHGLQAGDVDVHRSRADGAAARQRDVGLAEAREQRARAPGSTPASSSPARRARRTRGCSAVSTSMRMRSSTVTDTPMRPSSSIMVVTSCRCGTLPTDDRAVGQQRAGQDRQRRVLGAGDADLAFEGHAAGDLQLVHVRYLMPRAAQFLRRQRLDRQRVDLAAHALAERAIHELVALQRPQAGECLADDACACNARCRAERTSTRAPGSARADQFVNLFG